MKFDFQNLKIKKIIIHEIFKKEVAEQRNYEPAYSSELMDLSERGLDNLRERISDSVGTDTYCMEMDINVIGEESTFNLFADLIGANGNNYIRISKRIAKKLQDAITTKNMNGGIASIVEGTIGEENYRFGLVIKSDITTGYTSKHDSKKYYLEFLENLTLTPQNKMYQIGMFIFNKPNGDKYNAKNYLAYIYDYKLQKSEDRPSVLYFYERFLGCKISPTDNVLTRKFYDNTKYFNETHFQGEDILDQNSALYTFLKNSNRNTVLLSEYAEEYYPAKIRADFIDFMQDKGIPVTAFNKDTSDISNKLKRRNIKFNSDVRIYAPAEDFERIVKIDSYNETTEQTTLSIKGHIIQE